MKGVHGGFQKLGALYGLFLGPPIFGKSHMGLIAGRAFKEC